MRQILLDFPHAHQHPCTPRRRPVCGFTAYPPKLSLYGRNEHSRSQDCWPLGWPERSGGSRNRNGLPRNSEIVSIGGGAIPKQKPKTFVWWFSFSSPTRLWIDGTI